MVSQKLGVVAIQEQPITCPQCGFTSTAPMREDACLFFYECPSCRVVLRPKPEDCCVFCSFGRYPCPSRRQQFARPR
jgi:hypothetical protein